MTELEKMEYAKSFMDKLANGINPLDDSQIPEDDIVNNVRLSRCFFYVSDILRQVIENGGVTRPKKMPKAAFHITPERLLSFAYSEKPIPMSEIARRINGLVDVRTMKQLSYKQLTNWLISIDALTELPMMNGKTQKHPTEAGRQLGITVETRIGMRGAYDVIVYNREAQMFILDHISAIIGCER